MRLLAVDPGLSGCGWAVFSGAELFAAGFAPSSAPARTPEAWGPLASAVFSQAPAVEKLVVELMRIYTGGKSDPSDLLALQGLSKRRQGSPWLGGP